MEILYINYTSQSRIQKYDYDVASIAPNELIEKSFNKERWLRIIFFIVESTLPSVVSIP